MKINERTVTVNGTEYKVYSDYTKRGTYAVNPAGEEKALRTSGYISNERSVKKAIKLVFGEGK